MHKYSPYFFNSKFEISILITNQIVPKFIHQYIFKYRSLDLDYIIETQKIDDDLIDEYKEKIKTIQWNEIVVYQDLTKMQLIKYISYFNEDCWRYISKNYCLSKKFIVKYFNKLHKGLLLKNKNLSKENQIMIKLL